MFGKGAPLDPVEQGDAPMTQVQQVACRSFERAGVVDIEPGDRFANIGSPVQDEGDTQASEKLCSFVADGGRMQYNGVNLLTRRQSAVGSQFLLMARDRRHEHVDLLTGHVAADAGEKFRHMGAKLIGTAQHQTNGTGPSGGQAQRAGIGSVSEQVRGLRDAPPRGLVDFRIAIERAAHRGLRQAEMLGEVLQSHSGDAARTV